MGKDKKYRSVYFYVGEYGVLSSHFEASQIPNDMDLSKFVKFIEIQALKDRDALILELKGALENHAAYMKHQCKSYTEVNKEKIAIVKIEPPINALLEALNSEAMKKWEGRDG